MSIRDDQERLGVEDSTGNAPQIERPSTASELSPKANDERCAPTPGNESGDEGQKRINVTFTPQQYRILRDLATLQGINVSDVLRQAISITKLVVDANQKGKILIEQNGELQRLKIL
jgi:hypothetical protein